MEREFATRFVGFILVHVMIFVISLYFAYGIVRTEFSSFLEGIAMTLWIFYFLGAGAEPRISKDSSRFGIGDYTETISKFLIAIIFVITFGIIFYKPITQIMT